MIRILAKYVKITSRLKAKVFWKLRIAYNFAQVVRKSEKIVIMQLRKDFIITDTISYGSYNQSWLRDRIFPGFPIFLFWARSKNPENPEIPEIGIGIWKYRKVLREKSRKSQNPGDRDLKTSEKFWVFTIFWLLGFFRDFLKIPGIFRKSAGFGIFLVSGF